MEDYETGHEHQISCFGHKKHSSRHEVEPTENRKPRSRRPSLKKAISMLSEPGGRNSLHNTPPIPSSPPTVTKRKSFARKPSIDHYSTTRKSTTQRESIETFQQHRRSRPSQYYQDPEARMKLKLYLSSPRKFEEALEYGFPTAVESPVEPSAHRSPHDSIGAGRSSRDALRFLNNNTLSFLDAGDDGIGAAWDETLTSMRESEDKNDDDNISIADVETSLGPALRFPDIEPEYHRTPILPDHSTYSPVPYERQRHNSNALSWDGEREMTLRMTLTKPELRSSDFEIYGSDSDHHNPSDPLALEPLRSIEERASMAYISNPQDLCKVRSWWRKVKGTSNSYRKGP